ncbi:MAG: DUF5106 domain-containing protein [Marinifilaceae bacterium]
MKTFFVLCLTLCILFACEGNKSKQNVTSTDNGHMHEFALPTMPSYLTDTEGRVKYLVKNYWNKFNFKDTTWLEEPGKVEQIFADYVAIILQADESTGGKGIDSLYSYLEQEPVMLRHFMELTSKYLYDPNSPYRNETYYIDALENIIKSPSLTEDEKVRPTYRYEMAMKNRPGDIATDFKFSYASGKTGTLHQIDSDHVLLMFLNPDCDACKSTIEVLLGDGILNEKIKSKQIKVLTVYVDEEVDLWKKQIKSYPQEWLNGYDPTMTMRASETYNLNAIPTLYLLDKNKRVLLKDAIPEQVLYTISTF